jgi:hypothetical protein
MFHPDPRGILALVAVAICWTLAVVLRRVGMRGSVARKLALLLVVEGMTLGSSSSVDFLLTSPAEFWGRHPTLGTASMFVHTLGDCAMLALYPPFLAAALQTPLTRPFAVKRVQIAIVGTAGALFVFVMLGPFEIGHTLLYLALFLLFGFALVASIQAWLAASGAARARARAFTLAFGIRDICWGFLYGSSVWQLWTETYQWVADPIPPMYFVYLIGTLVSVPLIAYGILRTQLFDIDLRIRWTIKQSTLAALFLAIMFLLTEGADRLLSSELGNWGGLLAAAIVVFFLAPLQRLADRVAGAAMPNTKNTPEYVAFRKLQVYEAALAEALQGNGISDKERALLVRLRDTLGVSPDDARTMERELQIPGTNVP